MVENTIQSQYSQLIINPSSIIFEQKVITSDLSHPANWQSKSTQKKNVCTENKKKEFARKLTSSRNDHWRKNGNAVTLSFASSLS